MSDTAVFVIGFGTFALLLSGVAFTAYEIRRICRLGTTKD